MNIGRLCCTWGQEAREWPLIEVNGAAALIDVESAQIHVCAGTPEQIEDFLCGGCLKDQAGRLSRGTGAVLRELFRKAAIAARGRGLTELGFEPGHPSLVEPYRRIALRMGGRATVDCEGSPLFVVPL